VSLDSVDSEDSVDSLESVSLDSDSVESLESVSVGSVDSEDSVDSLEVVESSDESVAAGLLPLASALPVSAKAAPPLKSPAITIATTASGLFIGTLRPLPAIDASCHLVRGSYA
jgi:hypothetical protein